TVSRRAIITTGVGAAAGLGLLAACGTSNDSGGGANPAASTAAGATSGSTGGASTGIVALSTITVGQAVAATLDGKPIVVARPTNSTAAAFSAICTHQGCTVNVNGAVLNCPCHGSKYNALTGAVENGPANQPLPSVAVTVTDGQVVAS
ncbi:MAG TPA: Rieske (2Fe-2S) protein, partial [Nakamurella sp.]